MKQIIQNLKNGETILEDLPKPQVKRGHVLIQTTCSLVSLGTERMLVEFGKSNYIEKAKQQPEKVKQVLDKIKAEGLLPTVEAVFNKLDSPLPLGYCNVGIVEEVGKGVNNFNVGDRVASNGNHAEFVNVPENLVAHIPDSVSDKEAAFTVIGSIGLQGIRLINPTLGETVVVTGLGLIGLVTAQLLKSSGCNVIGLDYDNKKVELAKTLGIDAINTSGGNSPVGYVLSRTNGIGADAVVITASSKSDDIISQSAQMARKRGRVVLVGVIGLNINRSDFYEKEISFQVSCSYGPGRYDDQYEQHGNDYPIGFVRWTENRNFQAILNSIDNKMLNVKPLISEVVDFNNYLDIYGNMRKKGVIASILKYNNESDNSNTITLSKKSFSNKKPVLAIIGAGNFTQMTVLPTLSKIEAQVKSIVSAGGLTATNLSKKYKIPQSSTSSDKILEDNEISSVLVTTRHNLHSNMVLKALEKNKDVFVEKPLCLNNEELDEIIDVYNKSKSTITVGFNRRFAPIATKAKKIIGSDTPMNIVATMNAGFIPQNVWVHDMEVGGGRIIGEACHFIDLITFFTGSSVESVHMSALGKNPAINSDNVIITLKYENGSQGVINYFANGSKAYSKERVEIYSQQRTLIIDNWRTLTGYGIKGFKKFKSKIDKGHRDQFIKYTSQREEELIPFSEIVNTTRASFAAIESLKTGIPVKVKS